MACRAVAEAGTSAATASLDVEAEWPLLLVAGWLTTAADLMVEAALMEAARENRLLIGKGGIDGNVIRITPPMNISKTDVDDFAERLSSSLDRVGSLTNEYGRKSVL